MIIWLDNHLSPALARWIAAEFKIECSQVRDLGLARAPDAQIFAEAARVGACLVTKDADFAELVIRRGAPPNIILLTTGNTSTAALKSIFKTRLSDALSLAAAGAPLIEISG